MLTLTRFIGILIVAMGVIILFNPMIMKQLIAFWKQGKKLYIVGILRVLIGAILLLAASQAKIAGVVATLAVLILISGILIFILELEKVKAILDFWDKKSPSVLQLVGFLVLVVGILLIYSV